MLSDFNVGSKLEGVVLLSGISYSLTRNGSKMISCTVIDDTGKSTRAVCFDEKEFVYLERENVTNVEVKLYAEVGEYNGVKNLKILRLSDFNPEYDVSKYLAKLDYGYLANELGKLLKRLCSEKALKISFTFLESHKQEIFPAMASQYGGYHDGIGGGLLNHIRKLLRYTEIVLDEWREKLTDTEKDLIVLGILFHDIGKLIEIKNGSYTPESIVPHSVLGAVYFENNMKETIVSEYGSMFYHELLAIIAEHHGEFGERPKTVYAYLVHCIDLLDSRVSGLYEKVEDNVSVNFDDFMLKFNRY